MEDFWMQSENLTDSILIAVYFWSVEKRPVLSEDRYLNLFSFVKSSMNGTIYIHLTICLVHSVLKNIYKLRVLHDKKKLNECINKLNIEIKFRKT